MCIPSLHVFTCLLFTLISHQSNAQLCNLIVTWQFSLKCLSAPRHVVCAKLSTRLEPYSTRYQMTSGPAVTFQLKNLRENGKNEQQRQHFWVAVSASKEAPTVVIRILLFIAYDHITSHPVILCRLMIYTFLGTRYLPGVSTMSKWCCYSKHFSMNEYSSHHILPSVSSHQKPYDSKQTILYQTPHCKHKILYIVGA